MSCGITPSNLRTVTGEGEERKGCDFISYKKGEFASRNNANILILTREYVGVYHFMYFEDTIKILF